MSSYWMAAINTIREIQGEFEFNRVKRAIARHEPTATAVQMPFPFRDRIGWRPFKFLATLRTSGGGVGGGVGGVGTLTVDPKTREIKSSGGRSGGGGNW